MDALVLAGIVILIFGGAQFIAGLIFYSLMDVRDRIRARKYAEQITTAIQHRWQRRH